MIATSLVVDSGDSFEILAIGAHADDIEIGCAGTIAMLLERYSQARVTWIVFGPGGEREAEARKSADDLLRHVSDKSIVLHDFRDGFFPYAGGPVKDVFEELKSQVSPNVIFTHYGNDLHQDHRLVSELTWNTFRDHLILEYEVPKYDGDFGSPNVFVHLDRSQADAKTAHLAKNFQSQHAKPWYDEGVFRAVMRLRGAECNSPSGYAEGFYGRKLVLA
jgi:LmbE family N-acetylglucosaminyl deacetylase